MFKPGDRVVRTTPSIEPGNSEYTQQFESYTVVSIESDELKLIETVPRVGYENFVLEEVYNSPLYKALNENE